MLKISVAMAVFNGEKYIKKQLDSISNQSVAPYEIVIVDDNSADLSEKIIGDFLSNTNLNIKYYKNENNLGFIENFKKALSLISGDVCLLCDQDDIWETDKIKEMANIFADNSVLGCAGGFRLIDENDDFLTSGLTKEGAYTFLDGKTESEFFKIPFKKIVRRNIAPGCSCGYRKQVIDLFLKNSTLFLPHDYQLSTIAAALGGFYCYNKPLTRYRIHGGNTLGIKPLNQTRLDIAKEKLDLSVLVSGLGEPGGSYNKMSEKRYNCLRNKKPLKILSLFFMPQYREYYTIKERLGDLIYACK